MDCAVEYPGLAILGGGVSGWAICDEALRLGHKVTLGCHQQHQTNVNKVIGDGQLHVVRFRGEEKVEKTWTVGLDGLSVCGDLATVLRSHRYIYIGMTVTGDNTYNSQEDMIQRIIDTGVDTSRKVFVPINGLEFSWKADKLGLKYDFISTTSACQFAARLTSSGRSDEPLELTSKGKKEWMAVSIHPWHKLVADEARASELKRNLASHLGMTYGYCHRSLLLFSTINPNWHLPIVFGNTSKIDRKEPFIFYLDGLTESVEKNMMAFDRDRQSIIRTLGFEEGDNPTSLEIMNRMYGFDFKTPRECALGTMFTIRRRGILPI